VRTFIVVTFLLLGWGFWVASGGAGFVPEAWPEPAPEVAAPAPRAPAPTLVATPVVTRADLSLDAAPPAEEPVAEEVAEAPPEAPAEAIADSVAAALAGAAPPEAVPEAVPEALPEEPVETAAVDLREVTGDRVNMRGGPGTDYAVVGQLLGGAVAEVVEAQGEWVRVRDAAGVEGWMAAQFLAPL
jgi:hypothetical protein